MDSLFDSMIEQHAINVRQGTVVTTPEGFIIFGADKKVPAAATMQRSAPAATTVQRAPAAVAVVQLNPFEAKELDDSNQTSRQRAFEEVAFDAGRSRGQSQQVFVPAPQMVMPAPQVAQVLLHRPLTPDEQNLVNLAEESFRAPTPQVFAPTPRLLVPTRGVAAHRSHLAYLASSEQDLPSFVPAPRVGTSNRGVAAHRSHLAYLASSEQDLTSSEQVLEPTPRLLEPTRGVAAHRSHLAYLTSSEQVLEPTPRLLEPRRRVVTFADPICTELTEPAPQVAASMSTVVQAPQVAARVRIAQNMESLKAVAERLTETVKEARRKIAARSDA